MTFGKYVVHQVRLPSAPGRGRDRGPGSFLLVKFGGDFKKETKVLVYLVGCLLSYRACGMALYC